MALIDYTEITDVNPRSSRAVSVGSKKKAKKRELKKTFNQIKNPIKSKNNNVFKKLVEVSFFYESIDTSLSKTRGKGQLLYLTVKLKTNYDVFLDFSYLQVQSQDFIKKDNWESGNKKFIIGFNWLRFGTTHDAAVIDIYGGASFGQDNSSMITSRTDKIFGIQTIKRFFNMVLGLAYEMHFTGIPQNKNEIMIGDISKLVFSIGWIVSPDIKMSLDAETYSISSVSNSKGVYSLGQEQKFSTIGPKINLSFNSMVGFDLGATFRTRRLKNDELLDARLWNYRGSYGNSIYSGLWIHF